MGKCSGASTIYLENKMLKTVKNVNMHPLPYLRTDMCLSDFFMKYTVFNKNKVHIRFKASFKKLVDHATKN